MRDIVFCLLVCFHFLTTKLEERPGLHWRRRSFNSTWTVAHIPFPARMTDCIEAAWRKEATSPRGSGWPSRALEESFWSLSTLCRSDLLSCAGIWPHAVTLFLVICDSLNSVFHENAWCGGVSDASLTSQSSRFLICKIRSWELP